MKKYLREFYESMNSSVPLILLLVVVSAVCGFLYELLFYKIDCGEWINRGTTFGPWIPIYAIGGFLMALSTFRLRQNHHPVLIFLMSGIVCGILELIAGWVLLKFFGIRLWDYNKEIWNFGNIGGFICARSVLIFAVFGLLQNYAMIPVLLSAERKFRGRLFCCACIGLFVLFVLDILVSLVVSRASEMAV